MKPKSMRKTGPVALTIEWDDGHTSVYSFERLRDVCPCAECSGETVLFQRFVPAPPDRSTPGRYELKGIVPIGSYAVQMEWGDGHAAGIYTWDLLRANCPCPEHASGVAQ